MAFTKGTAKFTNGSKTVTNVSLTAGQLAYFASGTAVFVQSEGQLIEATGLPKDGNGDVIPNQFLLRGNWTGPTGSYDFVAFDTIEGLRDAVQSARGFSEQLKSVLDAVSVSPASDSLFKRTSDGRGKVANAEEPDDAIALGQAGSAYSRNVGVNDGNVAEYKTNSGLSGYGYGGLLPSNTWNISAPVSGFIANSPPGYSSSTYYGIKLVRDENYGANFAARNNNLIFQTVEGGVTQPWKVVWHSGNLSKGTDVGNVPDYTSFGLSDYGYGGGARAESSTMDEYDNSRFFFATSGVSGNDTGGAIVGIQLKGEGQEDTRKAQILMGYSGSIAGRAFIRSQDLSWSQTHELWSTGNLEPLTVNTNQTVTGNKTFRESITVDSGDGSYREISVSRDAISARIRCSTNDARTGFYDGTNSVEWTYALDLIATNSNVSINGDITTNSVIESSDQRLKANEYEVREHTQILDVWGGLRAKFFQWNRAIEAKGEEYARFHAGWMAQEIEQALVDSGLGIDAYGLICKEPVYEEQETGEVGEYQVIVTETVTENETEIKIIDGIPTQVVTPKDKQVECCDMVQVVDEAGNGLTEKVRIPIVDKNDKPVLDDEGNPTYATREEPITHPVPRMETKTRPVTQKVIVDYKYRLRYTQCLVLETAYLRRELDRLKMA